MKDSSPISNVALGNIKRKRWWWESASSKNKKPFFFPLPPSRCEIATRESQSPSFSVMRILDVVGDRRRCRHQRERESVRDDSLARRDVSHYGMLSSWVIMREARVHTSAAGN